MERRYSRQYENFDTIVPNMEEFKLPESSESKPVLNSQPGMFAGFKADDIILLVIIATMLMEEKKDMTTIAILGFLFLADYI